MNEQHDQGTCSKCGGATHVETYVDVTIRFTKDEYALAEKLAARRKEDVGQLIMHLLWLEQGLRKLR